MNARRRFLETMTFGSPDHVPLFREGMRSDVIRRWIKQGLRSEKELASKFHYDHREEIAPDLYARSQFIFESKSKLDLDRLQKVLDPDDKNRLPSGWRGKVRRWRQREHVLILRVHEGLFLTMGVDGWNSFSNVIELLVDNPKLARQIMDVQADFSARLTERILRQVVVDAVIFSEPISSSHGPLISPKMYEEIVLASYKPIFDVIKSHNIRIVIFRTYANSQALLPVILKTPINCLWASETNMDFMDYRILRESYGTDLGLIGGIDTDVLLQGKEAIQNEIEQKVPLLLQQGGYIPLADARIREYIPYENYIYYRELLEKRVFGG
jgi:hypothetical protein